MLDFLSDNFSNCVFIAVMLLAMIPTLESKVAIPFGMATQIWGEKTLTPILSTVSAFIGCMIPVLFVIAVSRFVKSKTSGFIHDKFVSKIQNRFRSKFEKLNKKDKTLKKCLLLATFVAIPLPLTGVYAGSLIAGFTDLKIWQAFLSVLVGEVFSCLAVLLLCLFFENSIFYVLIISLIFVGVYLLLNFILMLIRRFVIKSNKNNLS